MTPALALRPGVFADAPRCRYQAQDSQQTLAEGLAEYYASNRGRVTPPTELPAESADLFRSHDLCHVIFGLDTTLSDETMADARTLLCCDVGWARYGAYLARDPAAKALFKELGYGRALWATLRTAPRLVLAAREALRMRKRWPWTPPDAYLARSLADLRAEYRIRVV